MPELSIVDLARDFSLNLGAIAILAYALYFRRHGRRELLVGYVAFNVSLFAVAAALGSAESLTIGFGFGLFAVLSIVRLRSDETTQAEIGYTMVALVLGLLMGLPGLDFEMKALFAVVLVTAMYVVDSPTLNPVGRHVRQRLVIESVITDPVELAAEVERRLVGTVKQLSVRQVDYVRETTELDVWLIRDAARDRVTEDT